MKNIAIITARGGSKRIPKKNIRDFCGKPIIAYSIRAALDSGLFDEVMVSTDSEEIKAVAEQYGASVPFMRSEKNSNDYAVTADVLLEVLSEYKKLGKEYDYMCCLYPTALFITSEKLKSAFQKMQETGADALTPVVKFSFPPQRAFVLREGYLEFQYPEYAQTRSQDLEPIYHDCGQFYFYRTEAFFSTAVSKTSHTLATSKGAVKDDKKTEQQEGHREGKRIKTIPFILTETEVQDIDNEEDWKMAEFKFNMMKR